LIPPAIAPISFAVPSEDRRDLRRRRAGGTTMGKYFFEIKREIIILVFFHASYYMDHKLVGPRFGE